MKIADSSPYGDAFVSSIACSSESIATTGATGPNVSSLRDERVGGHVVEHRRLPVEVGREAVGARAAAARPRAPRSSASATCSSIFAATPLVVERAHRRRARRTGRRAGPARRRAARASRRTPRARRGARAAARRPCSSGPAQRKQAVDRRLGGERRGRRRRARRPGRCRRARARAALPAAASATLRPVSVEPMKPTPCVPGLRAISSPTTEPGPGDEVEDARRQVGLGDALGERDARRPRSSTPASTRRCSRTRAPARSARPASCTASSTGVITPIDAARPAHEQHALARRDRVREPPLEPLAVLGRVAPVLRRAPRPRRAPRRAAACPGRASACARARRAAARSRRRRGASRAARSNAVARAQRVGGARSRPRSRAARPRGRPAGPRRSSRRSPGESAANVSPDARLDPGAVDEHLRLRAGGSGRRDRSQSTPSGAASASCRTAGARSAPGPSRSRSSSPRGSGTPLRTHCPFREGR